MIAPIDKVLDEGNCGRAIDRGPYPILWFDRRRGSASRTNDETADGRGVVSERRGGMPRTVPRCDVMRESVTAPKDVSRASEVVLDAGSSPALGSRHRSRLTMASGEPATKTSSGRSPLGAGLAGFVPRKPMAP